MQGTDRTTRKLFRIYGEKHLKNNGDRLHIPRKDGGRGLIAIEDCIELAARGLNVHGSNERLLQTARVDRVEGLEAAMC